jgi:hypothetical protein
LPYAELVPLAVKLLDIPESIIETAIAQEIADEGCCPTPSKDKPCVFLAPLYYAEQSIAAQIQRLKTGGTTLPDLRGRQGDSLGRAEARHPTGRQPEAGHPSRSVLPSCW